MQPVSNDKREDIIAAKQRQEPVKSILRSLKARGVDEMLKALIISLNSITKTDIANWFKHDGYCVNA